MAKTKIEVLNFVGFSETGELIHAPVNKLSDAVLDLDRGTIGLATSGQQVQFNLSDVMAVARAEQKDVTDVRRTLGRMALTGLGFSLISRGSGVGSSLLDLSFRGAETKPQVDGLLIFRNSTIMKISVSGNDLGRFLEHLPPDALTQEAEQRAEAFFSLVQRMAEDGPAVLSELALEIESNVSDQRLSLAEIESGRSFAERDKHRSELKRLQEIASDKKNLLLVLLYRNGLSVHQFLREFGGKQHNQDARSNTLGFEFQEPVTAPKSDVPDSSFESKSANTSVGPESEPLGASTRPSKFTILMFSVLAIFIAFAISFVVVVFLTELYGPDLTVPGMLLVWIVCTFVWVIRIVRTGKFIGF